MDDETLVRYAKFEIEKVLEYLTEKNRPYSYKDIATNMSCICKAGVQRGLVSLVADSKVIEKVYGKQKIYVVRQLDNGDEAKMIRDLDVSIQNATEELRVVESEFKKHEVELKSITFSKTMEEIQADTVKIQAEIDELTDKLMIASKNNMQISPEKVKKAEEENKRMKSLYRSRKNLCMSIFDAILENCNKSKDELYDEIGMETDEEALFVMPN